MFDIYGYAKLDLLQKVEFSIFILPENGLKTPPLNYNNLSKLATLLDSY